MEKVWRRSKEVTRVVGLSSGSEVNELGQTSTLWKLAPQPGEQQWAQHIQGTVRTEGAGGWTKWRAKGQRTVCTMIGTVSRVNICSMGGWDPYLSNWHSSRLTLNTLAGVKFLLLWFPLLPVTKVSAFCPPAFFFFLNQRLQRCPVHTFFGNVTFDLATERVWLLYLWFLALFLCGCSE